MWKSAHFPARSTTGHPWILPEVNHPEPKPVWFDPMKETMRPCGSAVLEYTVPPAGGKRWVKAVAWLQAAGAQSLS